MGGFDSCYDAQRGENRALPRMGYGWMRSSVWRVTLVDTGVCYDMFDGSRGVPREGCDFVRTLDGALFWAALA